MPIEVTPSIVMILEAWHRIVAEHDMLLTILHLHIRGDVLKHTVERGMMHTIMIALHKKLFPMQLLEHRYSRISGFPEHVAQDVHMITLPDGFVPAANQLHIHLLYGLERPVVKGEAVGVIIMPVGDVEFFTHNAQNPFVHMGVAGRVGFEPTVPLDTPVFKTGTISLSVISSQENPGAFRGWFYSPS